MDEYVECPVCGGRGFYYYFDTAYQEFVTNMPVNSKCPSEYNCEICNGDGKISWIKNVFFSDKTGRFIKVKPNDYKPK